MFNHQNVGRSTNKSACFLYCERCPKCSVRPESGHELKCGAFISTITWWSSSLSHWIIEKVCHFWKTPWNPAHKAPLRRILALENSPGSRISRILNTAAALFWGRIRLSYGWFSLGRDVITATCHHTGWHSHALQWSDYSVLMWPSGRS